MGRELNPAIHNFDDSPFTGGRGRGWGGRAGGPLAQAALCALSEGGASPGGCCVPEERRGLCPVAGGPWHWSPRGAGACWLKGSGVVALVGRADGGMEEYCGAGWESRTKHFPVRSPPALHPPALCTRRPAVPRRCLHRAPASRCLAPWRRPRCRQVCDGGHQRGVPAQPGGERARQARQGRPRRPRAAGAAHAGRQQVCCGADVSGWRTSGGRGGAIVWREARPAALWCWVPVAVAARGRAELQMGAACRAGRVFRACKSFLACRASA